MSGCFAIGLFAGLLMRLNWSPAWRTLVVIGFLGGYTTFSSFSLETYNLLQDRSYGLALGNILGSVCLSLLGTWAGDNLSRALFGGGA